MVVITCGQVTFQQSDVTLYEDETVLDNGSIQISESLFSWEGAARKFSIPYNQITLHAIARAATEPNGDSQSTHTFPHSHLLIMVDGDRPWDLSPLLQSPSSGKDGNGQMAMQIDNPECQNDLGDNETDDSEDTGEDDRASDCPGTTSLLRFVPSDPSTLEEMYKVLSDCQALNPDDDLSGSDLEDLIEQENENGEDTSNNHRANACDDDLFEDPERFMDE